MLALTMSHSGEGRRLSPEEYLAWERAQPEKHEYVGGDVFAMGGASLTHSGLVANLVGELHALLRGKPCVALPSDLRVRIPSTGAYTYPDVSIVCGRPELEDSARDTLLNPTVLIEVLSPTTEAYDRGKKFEGYRSIASLRDYLLVSSTEILVEHFARQEDGAWLLRVYRAGERVTLSIGVELSVDELYLDAFGEPTGAAAAL
jgi:Uma2 family endonuclease